MIPIRDDNPHFLTPYVTYTLVGINALAWVLVQGLGTYPTLAESVCQLGLVPGELLQTAQEGTPALGDHAGWLGRGQPGVPGDRLAQLAHRGEPYVHARQLDAHHRQYVVSVDLRQ